MNSTSTLKLYTQQAVDRAMSEVINELVETAIRDSRELAEYAVMEIRKLGDFTRAVADALVSEGIVTPEQWNMASEIARASVAAS